MNDGAAAQAEKVRNTTNLLKTQSTRIIVSETYIREAILTNPISMGYVNLWTIGEYLILYLSMHNSFAYLTVYIILYIDIHAWENDYENIPNHAYYPLLKVINYYESLYNSYFVVNIIEYFAMHNITKDIFLRDKHHPNAFGYKIISDFVIYAMLSSWQVCLNNKVIKSYKEILPYPTVVVPAIEYIRVIDYPLLSKDTDMIKYYPYPQVGLKGN